VSPPSYVVSLSQIYSSSTHTKTNLKPTTHIPSIIMNTHDKADLPVADKPTDNIFQKAGHSIQNAAQQVKESASKNQSAASKEANKEQMKGNVPGQSGIFDRAQGGVDAVKDKADERKHASAEEANKHMK